MLSHFAHFLLFFFRLRKHREGCLGLSHVTKGVLRKGGGVRERFFSRVHHISLSRPSSIFNMRPIYPHTRLHNPNFH